MSPADLPLVFLLAGLLGASATCSGSETALFGLQRVERDRLAREHRLASRAVERLLARPSRLLITLLTVNMAVNVLYFGTGTVLAARAQTITGVVAVSGAVLATLVVLGEVVPKVVADANRLAVCRLVASPLSLVVGIVGPLVAWADAGLVAPLVRLLRGRPAGEPGGVSLGELAALIELGARTGALEEHEEQVLAGVVALAGTRIREVMTPRVDLAVIDADASPSLAAEHVARRPGHPVAVVEGSIDGRVLGLLDQRRVLALAETAGPKPPATVRPLALRVPFVPDASTLDQLLDVFRRTGARGAICVDEHGSVEGVVSLRDVVRTLVPAEPGTGASGRIEHLGPGEWEVPGRLGTRDWAAVLGMDGLPAPGAARAATVAGIILAALGRLPGVGDRVSLGNVDLEVRAMRGRLIALRAPDAHGETGA
jgi:putative hemolysin